MCDQNVAMAAIIIPQRNRNHATAHILRNGYDFVNPARLLGNLLWDFTSEYAGFSRLIRKFLSVPLLHHPEVVCMVCAAIGLQKVFSGDYRKHDLVTKSIIKTW